MGIALRINLYRNIENINIMQDAKDATQATQDTTQAKLTKEYKAVLAVIKDQPDITQKEIAAKLCWKVDRVKYYLNRLKKKNIIRRVGTSQNGHWEMLIEENIWQS